MTKVFLLQHSYEIDGFDETKTIGIYSTRAKAESIIAKYINLVGFKDYPEDCFYIGEYEIDKNHWEDGFIKCEDA